VSEVGRLLNITSKCAFTSLPLYTILHSQLSTVQWYSQRTSAMTKLFLGTWKMLYAHFIILIPYYCIPSGSSSICLFPNSKNNGLWFVLISNDSPRRYCRKVSQAQMTPNAFFSTCAYLCFVSVITLEAYATSLHWLLECCCISPKLEASDDILVGHP